jgi:hypothetical protein
MQRNVARIAVSIALGSSIGCRASNEHAAPPPASATAPSATQSASAAPATALSAQIELPAAELRFQRVAKSSTLLTIDRFENGALVRSLSEPPRDALLLGDHRLEPKRGLFSGLEMPKDWSFGPVEGSWPDFVLLTLADRGYRGFARDAKVLRKSGTAWKPLPGALGRASRFELLAPVGGKRRLLVDADDGARFVDLDGNPTPLHFARKVDGEKVTLTGASVDAKGRIFVSGFVPEPKQKASSGGLGLVSTAGGGVNAGIAVVERWEPGATEPSIDRMPDAKLAKVDDLHGAGVFSAGEVTFALFGTAHALGRFERGSWSLEALPIARSCSGVRDFGVAQDGSVWFGTTDDPSARDVYVRRGTDGRYSRLELPEKINVWGLYARSSTEAWLVASDADPKVTAGYLYFTQSLGPIVTL